MVIDNRYELIECLGSGNFGEVWRARDKNRGHVVALKMLKAGSSPDAAWREATRLTMLNSPVILGVNNAAMAVDVPYIDTVLCETGTIEIAIQPYGVAPARAVKWARQVCVAARLCHAQGILHRDIRPANVFRTPTDDVQLGDFGAAGLMDSDGKAAPFGHREAKAPELCWGIPASVQSDIWSVGATLFASLAGRPIKRDGAAKVAEDIRDACPNVSGSLARALRTALADNPVDRYGSLEEFDDRLAKLSRGARDFSEVIPHAGHRRCWLGAPVRSGSGVFICTETVERQVRAVATYQSSGRRVGQQYDEVVRPSALESKLRKLFDTFR